MDDRPAGAWYRRRISPLTALSVMAALPTLVAFAAGFGWPFELATHFRAQYLLALVPLSALCLYRRRFGVAAVVGLAAIYNGVLLMPLYFSGPDVPGIGATLRVMVANVHTSNRTPDPLIELVRQEDPDVVALLETDDFWLDALAVLHGRYPYRAAVPRSDNFGIAMFSRLPGELREVAIDSVGIPSIRATLQVGGRSVELIAVHSIPPTQTTTAVRDRQLRSVADLLADLPDALVLLGDLNATPWSPVFTGFLRRARLRDGRIGYGVSATWPSGLGCFGIPIDHVLVRGSVVVAGLRVGPAIGSDHRPLIAELVIE